MLNKDEMLRDLDVFRSCKANEDYLKKKYKLDNLEILDDVIEACVACGVEPGIIQRPYEGYYFIKLKRKKGDYDFIIQHNKPYKLSRSATHYTQNKDKWYIRFTCNGVGRLGMYRDETTAYTEAANKVWDEFIQSIKDYKPLDYDDWNEEFLFDVENGMKLYNDFETIYNRAYEGLRKVALEQKKKDLQRALDELERIKAL